MSDILDGQSAAQRRNRDPALLYRPVPPNLLDLFAEREIALTNGAPEFRSYNRPRAGQAAHTPDDGINPLLRRSDSGVQEPPPRGANVPSLVRLGFSGGMLGSGSAIDNTPLAVISDFMAHLPGMGGRNRALSFHITQEGPYGEIREVTVPFTMNRDWRSQRRDTYQDPQQAVSFYAHSTIERWLEEATLVFGYNHPDKSTKYFSNRITAILTPAAMKQAREEKARKEEQERKAAEDRKKREEEERKERETREAEEKATREKKEADEREQAEREQAEAAEAALRPSKPHSKPANPRKKCKKWKGSSPAVWTTTRRRRRIPKSNRKSLPPPPPLLTAS